MPFYSILFDNGGMVDIDVGGLSYFYAKLDSVGTLQNLQPFEGGVHLDSGSPLLAYQSDSHIIRRSYYQIGQDNPSSLPAVGDGLTAWLSSDMPPAILMLYSARSSDTFSMNENLLLSEASWSRLGDDRQALLAVEPSIYELVPGKDYQQFLQAMAKQEKACSGLAMADQTQKPSCLVSRQLPVIFAIKAKKVIHLDKTSLQDEAGVKAMISRFAPPGRLAVMSGGKSLNAIFTRYEAAHEEVLPLIWRCDGPTSCYPSGTDKDNGETLVYAVLASSAGQLLEYLASKVSFSLSVSPPLQQQP